MAKINGEYFLISKFKKKKVRIDDEQVIYWMQQLLTAIDCLHKNKIIHQFIGPEYKKILLNYFRFS